VWRGETCVAILVLATFLLSFSNALAASGKQPAPPGAFDGAPAEFTRFTAAEFRRGFLVLAFGSDLRIGAEPRGIRRFDRPIRARIFAGGSVDRGAAMARVIEEYARKIPNLNLSVATSGLADFAQADLDVRLIDDKDFKPALHAAFGAEITEAFVKRTHPQCMTSVKSTADGAIVHAISILVVDKGDAVFLDCAYHELLHAFGLSNHDQRNAWTTLSQRRMVGYLTAYDRGLLTLLYDPRIAPGMTPDQVRSVLPRIIDSLGLAR
jgi:hypothetical protein